MQAQAEIVDPVIAKLRAEQDETDRKTIVEGFAVSELRKAFEAVEDKENWKMPIKAVIAEADIRKTQVAIRFFAGSVSTVKPVGRGQWQIKAPGYYKSVGA